jgi:hypothetical protein
MAKSVFQQTGCCGMAKVSASSHQMLALGLIYQRMH